MAKGEGQVDVARPLFLWKKHCNNFKGLWQNGKKSEGEGWTLYLYIAIFYEKANLNTNKGAR